jgi:hypothetical protein
MFGRIGFTCIFGWLGFHFWEVRILFLGGLDFGVRTGTLITTDVREIGHDE